MRRKQPQKGFSFMEVLVAIILLSVMATLAIPKILLAVEKIRVQEQITILATVWNAQKQHYQDNDGEHATTGPVNTQLADYLNIPPSDHFDEIQVGCGSPGNCPVPFQKTVFDCPVGKGGTGITKGWLAQTRRWDMVSGQPAAHRYFLYVLEDGQIICVTESADPTCTGLCARLGFQPF